jgi:MYXO-CTERM domain-containing protein
LLVLVLIAGLAHAAPPEPTGPHPRMLLDADLKAAWQAQAKLPHGPVVGAIRLCEDARTGHEYDRAVYQGAVWAKVVQACLVAWAATDNKDDAQTAIRFTQALLDDLDMINDKAGGDAAARRDDGYAIRNLGPYTALAYDWLHDQMPPALRERARARWKAWLDWYREHGYRAHDPGSNYHAGYLISATMIAIAEAGEGDSALWREVADTMWGKEMAVALSDDGVLRGGDWPEGWQYGPLAVAEYSLAARVARGAGIPVNGVSTWLSALLRRHVYGLSPADGVYAGGDTEDETPNLKPSVLTLDAIALGDATPDDKRWARGELSRLKLTDQDYLLYDALAGVGDKPVLVPRATWPTWYVADGTGTLFARTRWDGRGVWFVTTCHAAIDTDHRHPDAGNFVLSRGADDVIADPSPYGTQSTLTSNAPTVASAQLPKEYIPSQAFWSEKTSFDWATQRKSGVIATRCDYSDQYKFQDRRSDVPDALRDLVVIPSEDGTNAAVVVIDRANTTDTDRHMYLRFRTPGHLALAGTRATATVGSTALAITPIGALAAKPAIGAPAEKDCFKEGTIRGQCDAARFPTTDYRVELPGPKPVAVHLITATDPSVTVTATPLDGGVHLAGMRDATIVWHGTSYTTPPGLQIVLDAPPSAAITAKHTDGGCSVDIASGGTFKGSPLTFALDASCKVIDDPEGPAASAARTRAATSSHGSRSPRSGCCGANAAPDSPLAMAVVVVGVLVRRRRRRSV